MARPKKEAVVAAAVVAPVAAAAVEVAHVFKPGDKVVYPPHGVGLIESVETRKVANTDQKFFVITIFETGMKIRAAIGQVKTVGMRKVIDSKMVEEIYDILKDRNVALDTQTWNRRFRDYSQKIKTGSVIEIAKVIRDLSVLKSDKELSFGERRMLESAQGLLVKEISIAKASPEDTVKAELQLICQPSA